MANRFIIYDFSFQNVSKDLLGLGVIINQHIKWKVNKGRQGNTVLRASMPYDSLGSVLRG